MGAAEPVGGRERERERRREEGGNARNEEGRGVEQGEMLGVREKVIDSINFDVNNDLNNHPGDSHVAMMQRLNPTNPLRIVAGRSSRMPTPSPSQTPLHRSTPTPQTPLPRFTPTPQTPLPRFTPTPQTPLPRFTPTPQTPLPRSTLTPQTSPPRSSPTPQPSVTTLSSRRYTNKISLFLFVFHLVAAVGLVSFLIFKGIQGLIEASESVKRKERNILKFYLPQVEAASLLSITLAFAWQKAVRQWPRIMVHFILWSSFFLSLSAGILLICFQKATTDAVGVCLIAFAIGNGLYACWVTPRIGFCTDILIKSLEPVPKLGDLNRPTYCMLGVGFLWMSLWILAVIGAMNFYLTPVVIIALVLSLTWTAEVMRNIVNLTVSRVIVLYYLRGMQSSTLSCFQRAVTLNLGSACLGSLFVPTIEALRIVVRGLNLLEGEDEFMFSCAHCCLDVLQCIFRYGNGWAYVQIAAYGKGFVQASQDSWHLFQRQGMEPIVDSDITSSVCFLAGVCSGSICVIAVAAWTAKVHQTYTATLSLLSFFIGYLMTRIAMALPQACVSCYYVCYAENPSNILFDKTIQDHQTVMAADHDVEPTPRLPHRFSA
ncbi:CHOLINE TRANSPORTER-LIKE (SLC FAMILY 44) [Salix purpurea]|uniref:Choline transporter-like protein n=1 Tax=Salix purpurea TaxID=77065 RepID=A0A9Q0PQ50_SALPP|nr:CHOLINE TRANSPORTER-LIKE (SLC FAMILY 44) [Salix purpurea]